MEFCNVFRASFPSSYCVFPFPVHRTDPTSLSLVCVYVCAVLPAAGERRDRFYADYADGQFE
jgi:hypothetical protein